MGLNRLVALVALVTLIVLVVFVAIPRRLEPFESGVDVVYTWVDSSDGEWRSQLDSYAKRMPTEFEAFAARYPMTKNPWEEISVSIESVRTYLPWVSRIYVVTQRPHRVPIAGVTHVFHDEIFPDPSVLPVFSSHAIETCLHRIPGLSERFIYLNDDTYITKPMEVSDFFKGGLPIARIYDAHKISSKSYKDTKYNVHNSAILRMSEVFGDSVWVPIHQATPLTKSIMANAEDEYRSVWEATRTNRFRVPTNIVPVYLALNLAIRKDKVARIQRDRVTHIYADDPSKVRVRTHLACFNNLKDSKGLRKYVLG